jgi:hypothetical protein
MGWRDATSELRARGGRVYVLCELLVACEVGLGLFQAGEIGRLYRLGDALDFYLKC